MGRAPLGPVGEGHLQRIVRPAGGVLLTELRVDDLRAFRGHQGCGQLGGIHGQVVVAHQADSDRHARLPTRVHHLPLAQRMDLAGQPDHGERPLLIADVVERMEARGRRVARLRGRQELLAVAGDQPPAARGLRRILHGHQRAGNPARLQEMNEKLGDYAAAGPALPDLRVRRVPDARPANPSQQLPVLVVRPEQAAADGVIVHLQTRARLHADVAVDARRNLDRIALAVHAEGADRTHPDARAAAVAQTVAHHAQNALYVSVPLARERI